MTEPISNKFTITWQEALRPALEQFDKAAAAHRALLGDPKVDHRSTEMHRAVADRMEAEADINAIKQAIRAHDRLTAPPPPPKPLDGGKAPAPALPAPLQVIEVKQAEPTVKDAPPVQVESKPAPTAPPIAGTVARQ